MFGPSLLAAPVTSPGSREVEVYLPRGPECWRDFWTGAIYAPGRTVVVEAPLERLPLLAPAGAIVATTDAGKDYSRLHDKPSRALLVYPGERSGRSSAVHLRGRRDYARWAAHEGDDRAGMERGGGSGRRFRAGRL